MTNIQNYQKQAQELRDYSDSRKGPLSKLTYEAARTIETLVGRVVELEERLEREEDDGK